jgi:uncharacterized protein
MEGLAMTGDLSTADVGAAGRRKRWRIRIAGLSIAAGLAVWAFFVEPSRLVRRDVTIVSEHWPAGAAPLRVAVIGDIHGGAPYVGEAKLARLVAMANEASPDAVLLLGDYVINGVVGGRFMPPEIVAARLGGLRSKYGTFAVLGNHDWWSGGERVRRALQSAGITVLENEAVSIDRGSDRVYVVGLADTWTRPVDFVKAFGSVPDAVPVLAMVHEPDAFVAMPSAAAVTFAAHTHGGQVWLPFFGPPVVPSHYGRRYAAGHVVEGGRDLFVTTGVGTSILPIRFGVPPEIVIATISAVAPSSAVR